MSLPNPADERPSEVPASDPLESPAPDVPSPPRPSYEQTPYSPYPPPRDYSTAPGPISDPTTVTPPPPFATPVSPSPYAPPPPGMETPPAPYPPGTPPNPYQTPGMTPPVYTQQPYSQYQPYPQQQSASSNAIASLVCGILSWTLCGAFTGLPAAILGFGEVKKIDRGESPPSGRSMAQWGAWLGLINCAVTAIGVAIYLLLIMAVISIGATTP